MKNKKLKKLLIFLIIIISIFIVIYVTISLFKKNYRNLYDVTNELIFEEVYNQGFNKINIDSTMCDIYIKNSLDNTFKISFYGDKDYISINIIDNKLNIATKKRNLIAFDIYKYISKIEIYVPNYYDNFIEINNKYGNIEIDSYSLADFEIENEYGNISMIDSNFADIDNEHGNILIEKSNKLRVNVEFGDLNIKEVNDVEINSKYGNINIENILEYFEIDSDNGNILINKIKLNKNSLINAKYGDIKINQLNEVFIKAKTDRGNVKIKKNYKESNIILDIYTEKGNINIE